MNNNVRPGQFILSLPEKRAKKVWLNHIKPVHSHRCFAQDAYARASVTITLRGFTGHKAAASPPGPAFDMLKPGYESRRMGITERGKSNPTPRIPFCTSRKRNFPLEISLYTSCKLNFPLEISLYTSCKLNFPLEISFCTSCKRNFPLEISFCTSCKTEFPPGDFILHVM